MVVFNDKEVVTAVLDDLLTNLPLTEHCVARDDPPLEYQGLQQLQGGLDFVGLRIDRVLAERIAGRMIQRRQELNRGLVRL